MEIFLEFFAEVLFQLVFEVFFACLDGSLEVSSRIRRTILKLLFYLGLGVLLGVSSLAIWPHPLLSKVPGPLMSLLLVPFAVGCATVLISRFFEEKFDWDIETSRFLYSFYLAFVFAVTRFTFLN